MREWSGEATQCSEAMGAAAVGAIDADFVMKILFFFVGLGSSGLIRVYVVILFLTMLSFERTLYGCNYQCD